MKKQELKSVNQNFSDLPVNLSGRTSKKHLWTFILELITWIAIIITVGIIIIFNPLELDKALPYLISGMLLASSFWYLEIRALYINLNKEKLQREKEFQEIQKKQVELDKREKEFIAITSHELNTPLSMVRNASSELIRYYSQSKKVDSKVQKLAESINESSKKMVKHLNDLMSVIRSDQSILKIEDRSCPIKELVEKSLEVVKDSAAKKKINIKFIPSEKISNIVCDPERVTAALTNIIDNAINYSNEDSDVTIKVKESGNYAQFSVENYGFGINKEDSTNVFQRFYRSTKAKSLNPYGTGLGLSIARDVIIQQGGTLWFESTPEKVTTFYLTLPKV